MSLNDRNLGVAIGVDVHDGVANPTASNNNSNPMETNFVTDPTTESRGAGAGPNFEGDRQAMRTFKETAGVVEGRPGIIESTNIDPINEHSNDEDGWANATKNPSTGSAQSAASSALETGMQAVQSAKEAVFGK